MSFLLQLNMTFTHRILKHLKNIVLYSISILFIIALWWGYYSHRTHDTKPVVFDIDKNSLEYSYRAQIYSTKHPLKVQATKVTVIYLLKNENKVHHFFLNAETPLLIQNNSLFIPTNQLSIQELVDLSDKKMVFALESINLPNYNPNELFYQRQTTHDIFDLTDWIAICRTLEFRLYPFKSVLGMPTDAPQCYKQISISPIKKEQL